MVVHSFIPQTFPICHAVFRVPTGPGIAFIGGYVGVHMRLVGTRAVVTRMNSSTSVADGHITHVLIDRIAHGRILESIGARAGVYETVDLRGSGIDFKVSAASGRLGVAWLVAFFTFVSVSGTSNAGCQ
jgi:hypothetical protein